MNLKDRQFNNLNTLASAVELGTSIATEAIGETVGDKLVNDHGRLGVAQMILARIRQRHPAALGA